MPLETDCPPDAQSVTGLVSGIVADAQELLKQQVALVRAEIKADLRRLIRALVLLAIGSMAAVPAVILLCNAVVFALHDFGGLPLWAGYGIFGGVLAVFSAGFLSIGVQRFRSINGMPDQSVEAFKENVRWMMNPK
jgi:hypothetical protein